MTKANIASQQVVGETHGLWITVLSIWRAEVDGKPDTECTERFPVIAWIVTSYKNGARADARPVLPDGAVPIYTSEEMSPGEHASMALLEIADRYFDVANHESFDSVEQAWRQLRHHWSRRDA